MCPRGSSSPRPFPCLSQAWATQCSKASWRRATRCQHPSRGRYGAGKLMRVGRWGWPTWPSCLASWPPPLVPSVIPSYSGRSPTSLPISQVEKVGHGRAEVRPCASLPLKLPTAESLPGQLAGTPSSPGSHLCCPQTFSQEGDNVSLGSWGGWLDGEIESGLTWRRLFQQ